MESRHSMVVGGAAVAVITLAVASAVTITDAVALRDSRGHALVASTIVLPSSAAPAAASTVSGTSTPAPVAPQAKSASATRSGAPSTAELVPAPDAVTVPDRTSSASGSAAESSPAQPADAGQAPASQQPSKNAKAKHHGKDHPALAPTHRLDQRATRLVTEAPALVAGPESGKTESPSSTAGSKKGQSRHSPDARD